MGGSPREPDGRLRRVSYRTVNPADGSSGWRKTCAITRGPESDLDTGPRCPLPGRRAFGNGRLRVAKYGLLYDCATADGICPPAGPCPACRTTKASEGSRGFLIPTRPFGSRRRTATNASHGSSYFWSSINGRRGFQDDRRATLDAASRVRNRDQKLQNLCARKML